MTLEALIARVAAMGPYGAEHCSTHLGGGFYRVFRMDDSGSGLSLAMGESPEQAFRIFNATKPETSGYQTCGCRDCGELTVGVVGEFCEECITAGCPDYQGVDGLSQECQRPDAYGCDSEDDSEEQGEIT